MGRHLEMLQANRGKHSNLSWLLPNGAPVFVQLDFRYATEAPTVMLRKLYCRSSVPKAFRDPAFAFLEPGIPDSRQTW